MRIIFSLCSLLVFVAATVVGDTDLAHSQADPSKKQTVSRNGQAPPCGAGTRGLRFVLFEDGRTVCDNASGLVWDRAPGEVRHLDFTRASAYCAAKGSGWTVPALKDFFTLVDYGNANPPLPNGHPFEIIYHAAYWSDTPSLQHSDSVWTFTLDYGRIVVGPIASDDPQGIGDFTWCVRY